VVEMVLNAELTTNQLGHAASGPDVASKAKGLSPTRQQHGQVPQLLWRQPRGWTWRRSVAQGGHTSRATAADPLADGAFGHSECCRNVALFPAMLLEVPRAQASPLTPIPRARSRLLLHTAWPCTTRTSFYVFLYVFTRSCLSAAYISMLASYAAYSSVGRPGTCFDNAAAESFFATLKTELIHRAVWPTRQHARTAIFHYVEGFYNRLRRHSTLAYRSPADFEADHRSTTLAV
jgi:hypothetical protein